MSEDAVMAKKGPFGVVVKKGQTYWWCACGLSKSQPFCDGSHKGTSFEPIKYVGLEYGINSIFDDFFIDYIDAITFPIFHQDNINR